MAVSIFTFVDLFRRHLDTAAHLLTKGSAFATANGFSEQDMLGWRLADDMHPLGFQVMVVVNFSQSWPARAAGLPVPEAVTADLDVAGFQAAIVKAKAFLATLTAEHFAGREDVPLTVQLGETMEPTLPAGHWVSVFAATNIAFHASITYAILRMKGVPLGKIDMFASGL
ncbi:MAG: hypothetical protein BVN32_04195 [Proteobacteria bacterium ST_bin14]|nr:MAG: hypothetical protein BVN32_04195 [Proteobacteria bacterium ST_bin14]